MSPLPRVLWNAHIQWVSSALTLPHDISTPHFFFHPHEMGHDAVFGAGLLFKSHSGLRLTNDETFTEMVNLSCSLACTNGESEAKGGIHAITLQSRFVSKRFPETWTGSCRNHQTSYREICSTEYTSFQNLQCTQQWRLLGQEVREKCRGFVSPPRVFPLSVWATFMGKIQTVTQKFTHLSTMLVLDFFLSWVHCAAILIWSHSRHRCRHPVPPQIGRDHEHCSG